MRRNHTSRRILGQKSKIDLLYDSWKDLGNKTGRPMFSGMLILILAIVFLWLHFIFLAVVCFIIGFILIYLSISRAYKHIPVYKKQHFIY